MSSSKKTSTSQQILSEIQSMKAILEAVTTQISELSKQMDELRSSQKTAKKKASPKKTKIVKSGNVCINRYNDVVLVTGQTYDKRAVLKKYKALWNKEKKGWTVKLDKYDDLKTDLESHCNLVDEKSIDEYFFDETTVNSIGSNNSGDDHSVDSSFNPNAQYAFLDDED
tara:strand:+ start:228 stop:734 length:507 start_codon:yes stop_codon:yes gene_type:complete